MSKLTLDSFEIYKNKIKEKKAFRGSIVLSYATCGIAAGGDKVYDVFAEELKEKQLSDIELKKTGCLGMCFCEPNMFVNVEGMPEILYGHVTPEIAKRIVDEHIIRKQIVNDYVIFMPAKDLCGKLCK